MIQFSSSLRVFAWTLVTVSVVIIQAAEISRQECEAQGGQVVSDIGDGAIWRDDYKCKSTNEPPTDAVVPVALPGELRAMEGEVCCGGTGDGIILVTIGAPATEPVAEPYVVGDDDDNNNNNTTWAIPISLPISSNSSNSAQRAELTREECFNQLGYIVGDIGDGAIFDDSYVCETSGLPPIGNILPLTSMGESAVIAMEGEVCCGPMDASSICPNLNDDCMNQDALNKCETLVYSGCLNVLIMESCPLTFECQDYSHCPDISNPCMNAENLQQCHDLVESGNCAKIAILDSCPLQFSCEMDPMPPPFAERPGLSRDECVEQGGSIVGDIGDGAIFNESYTCESSGLPPIANIIQDFSTGTGIAIEGEVCCGINAPYGGGDDNMPICPNVQDSCMNEENFKQCQDLVESGCENVLIMESCPLQFSCGGGGGGGGGGDPSLPPPTDATGEPRGELTRDECVELEGGTIVGDIGDGAIFEETYVCESSGLPPIANIIQPMNGNAPVAIEGEVCCGRPIVTRQECTDELDGIVVSDVGDGSSRRPDYRCDSNGAPILAIVVPADGEPMSDEGEVCCGAESVTPVTVNRQECTNDLGGILVQDTGDGSSRRPGFICESSGEPILAIVVPVEGESIAREGEVCCGLVPSNTPPPSCPEVNDSCMNEENSKQCQQLIEDGCQIILQLESCPLQFGCGDEDTTGGVDPIMPPMMQRAELTRDECELQGGNIVGDIGDGAIFLETYICESSGSSPIANIVQDMSTGTGIAIEGEVCCGVDGQRAEMSREECTLNLGGNIVVSRDGSIFETSYVCESSGLPPLANIIPPADGNAVIAIEGEVCCGGPYGGVMPGIGGGDDIPDEVPIGGGGGLDRIAVTREECVAQGGSIVGDIGDGGIFAESYVCESNGLAPFAIVVQDTSISSSAVGVAIEGEVCCGASGDAGGDPVDPVAGGNVDPVASTPESGERGNVTRDECEEQGGIIVGDIGDGAIFEDEYVCESSGLPPFANIIQDANGTAPIAIEGEVCCSVANATPADGGGDDVPVSNTTTGGPEDDTPPLTPGTAERDEVTREECEEAGGSIVGDLGDGAIFEAAYVCEKSGMPPIANILQDANGTDPIATEGEVCCGAPGGLDDPNAETTTADDGSQNAAAVTNGGGDASSAESTETSGSNQVAFFSRGAFNLLAVQAAAVLVLVFSL